MNKAVSIGLLVGGILLIAFGYNASQSFGSEVSRAFTGSPTDKSMWMMIGGAVAAVVGLVGLMRSPRA
ncbi:MAG: DUF3185 family protein [Verrucomicrobia bacterium]|nr:DUF3185 family protein [Verrucomicrobiota bacterium]